MLKKTPAACQHQINVAINVDKGNSEVSDYERSDGLSHIGLRTDFKEIGFICVRFEYKGNINKNHENISKVFEKILLLISAASKL